MRDAELDAALRSLTALDPAPRLQGRVLRAIADDAPEPVRLLSRIVWASACGVVLAATLAGVRLGRPVAPPRMPAAPPLVAMRALGVPAAPESLMTPVVRRRALPRRVERERDWPYTMAALARPSLLSIDRLPHDAIAREPLEIEPLRIADLTLTALDR